MDSILTDEDNAFEPLRWLYQIACIFRLDLIAIASYQGEPDMHWENPLN